jgi:hypothetical protein
MKHKFQIAIGDWSGDGHGKCEYYTATSAKPINNVRDAYWKACDLLPKEIHPKNIAERYESTITPKQYKKLVELGAPLEPIEDDDDIEFCPSDMAAVICWFINQGDPTADVSLEKYEISTLHQYGYDMHGRHIGHLGYGLF